jgi:hypothetical protein
MTLIERLAALVPRPRVHLTTYHGVFAPAASYAPYLRKRTQGPRCDRVVPPPPEADQDEANCSVGSQQTERTKRKRYSWAELMKRVFAIDVLRTRPTEVLEDASHGPWLG